MAHIASTRIDEDWRKDGTYYLPAVYYGYQVGGQICVRPLHLPESKERKEAEQEAADKIKTMTANGKLFPVYYDPKNPDDALLHSGNVAVWYEALKAYLIWSAVSLLAAVIGLIANARLESAPND